jgi:hypothetical protein
LNVKLEVRGGTFPEPGSMPPPTRLKTFAMDRIKDPVSMLLSIDESWVWLDQDDVEAAIAFLQGWLLWAKGMAD